LVDNEIASPRDNERAGNAEARGDLIITRK